MQTIKKDRSFVKNYKGDVDMFGEHLKEVRCLMDLRRYQNKFTHKSRTVAEHTWFVSKIAHGLGIWERDKFKKQKVDMEKVLFLAMNHDMIEAYTGDIISTTKQLSSVLKEELIRVEEVIFNTHVINTIPESWGHSYTEIHDEMTELKSVESRIVKAGDLIDRVFECIEEVELGNINTFEEILEKDLDTLGNFGLISVDYFLKYSIKDISSRNVDAYGYIPEYIRERLEAADFSEYF